MTDLIPPNVIWLQWFSDEEITTWCEDRINQNDVRYVRVGMLLEVLRMGKDVLTRDDILKLVEN